MRLICGAPVAWLDAARHQQRGGQGPAIEVAVSPDGNYAFLTNEYNDLAAVFNLRLALARGFGAAGYVGSIPLGEAAVGMAVSPDGRWLYATSEAGLHQRAGTLAVINRSYRLGGRQLRVQPAGSGPHHYRTSLATSSTS